MAQPDSKITPFPNPGPPPKRSPQPCGAMARRLPRDTTARSSTRSTKSGSDEAPLVPARAAGLTLATPRHADPIWSEIGKAGLCSNRWVCTLRLGHPLGRRDRRYGDHEQHQNTKCDLDLHHPEKALREWGGCLAPPLRPQEGSV